MKYLGYVFAFVLGVFITWLWLTKFQAEPRKVSVGTIRAIESKEDISEVESKKSTSNLVDETHELAVNSSLQTEEIADLKKQLTVMSQTNQVLSQRIKILEQPKQVSNKEKDNEGIFEGIPESHLKMLQPDENKRKTLDELHRDFVEQEEDISWATLKEQQLNYYFTGHRLSNFVQLHLVECKATMCEVFGTEIPSDNEAWFTMTDELRNEPWANFSGNSTSSTNGENGNQIFVTILSKPTSGGE